MSKPYSKIAVCVIAFLLVINVAVVSSINKDDNDTELPQQYFSDIVSPSDGMMTTTSQVDDPVSSSDGLTSTTPTETTTTTEYREEVVVDLPYYIEVDKQKKVVSIYTTNEEGKYETLVRQMICSTEEDRGKFPDGMYQLSLENRRFEWRMMKSHGEEMFAQYACTISGDFMFHSVPYSINGDKSSLYEWRYTELGTACTGGCIRLTVECAKWIYDNCPPGTPVCIMRSESFDPELIEKLRPPAPVDGWDPTDPDPNNPHYQPMYDPATEPKPDKYAELYDYNFKWAPECTKATVRTTTTTTTTTAVTTEATTAATTAAPTEATTAATQAPGSVDPGTE